MKICTIPGCGKLHAGRGFCQMHYTRWKRHGNPLTNLLPGNGWVRDGYKVLMVGGRQITEHRFVMETFLGRRLSNHELVHHKDGNRLNNAIENLELTTRSEHAKIHHELGYKVHPVNKSDTHRWCGACRKAKPISEFQICKRNRSGVQSQCKKCRIKICHNSYMKSPRRAHIIDINRLDI